ncbi:PREDICTED: reticuline oxidase-like protein [Tarenaya hassleriana]|uniref:reticuline oxidase-like protein n=1 Tax=Tarenaya hassleriana TaxID=28532 RepID=UPI00053C9699|nr:PREDICTED: reticuline oxidase-like protein [Tarenaya hassleriana]
MKIFTFVLIFISIFVSSSSANNTDSTYEILLACFTKYTGQSAGSLSDVVLPRGSSSFAPALNAYIRNARFNTSTSLKPTVLILPRVYPHVQAAVVCARTLNLRLKIRSGGHDYDGLSYTSAAPFVVLDLSNLRNITVDAAEDGGSAWVEAGATIGELYYQIWKKSEIHGFPAGVCPTVGIGGHISGGGYGNMIRRFGLTVDYVVDARIVSVDGRILDRKAMGEDLFWAIRGGGGGSFAVVLAFKIKLVTVPRTVTVFRVVASNDENALNMAYKWQFVAPRTDTRLFMRLLLASVTENKTQTVQVSVRGLFLGNANDVVSLLTKEFPELGLKHENCTEMTWIQSVLWWDNHKDVKTAKPEILLDREPGSAKYLKRKSDYMETEMTKTELYRLFQKLKTVERTGLVLNPYGGKMNETSTTETPFPHRQKLYKIQHSTTWNEPGTEPERRFLRYCRSVHEYMTPFVSKNPRSAYFNYRDIDIGVNNHGNDSYREGEIYGKMYFGENFDRLVRVKTEVDPGNFFRNEQSIPTLPR